MSTYKEDISIDRFALDEELSRQPILVYKYGEALADAIRDRDRMKESFSLLCADLDSEIRNSPDSFDIHGKLTEGGIRAAMQRDREYIKRSGELIEAEHTVNVLETAKAALNHKKSSLEGLIKLYLASYWGENVPANTQRKFSDVINEQGSAEIRASLQENKRLKRRARDED